MRYAVYFTPAEDDPLTVAVNQWLGYNAFTGENVPYPETIAVQPGRMSAITAAPARYGFHATLKAPFRLAENFTSSALVAAFDVFCRQQQAFDLPEIQIGQLGSFFALVPAQPSEKLQSFAAQAVEYFEPMRAPLTEEEIARRKPEALTEVQRDHLMQWGYPYVFDEFRFHMTLTGSVQGTDRLAIQKELEAYFAPFAGKPLTISGLGLFVEEDRGAPFTIHRWQPLSGGAD